MGPAAHTLLPETPDAKVHSHYLWRLAQRVPHLVRHAEELFSVWLVVFLDQKEHVGLIVWLLFVRKRDCMKEGIP